MQHLWAGAGKEELWVTWGGTLSLSGAQLPPGVK